MAQRGEDAHEYLGALVRAQQLRAHACGTIEHRLALRAERKWEPTETEGKNYHQVEHRYGAFTRTFALPRGVDGDNAEARYTDGVLRITLPKREPATRSKVQIQG